MADTLVSKYYHVTGGTAQAISPTDAHTKTILSVSFCNLDTTDTATFHLVARNSSNADFGIYRNQSIPPLSTFIHNSKIIFGDDEELIFDQTSSTNCDIDIVVSYLNQTA